MCQKSQRKKIKVKLVLAFNVASLYDRIVFGWTQFSPAEETGFFVIVTSFRDSNWSNIVIVTSDCDCESHLVMTSDDGPFWWWTILMDQWSNLWSNCDHLSEMNRTLGRQHYVWLYKAFSRDRRKIYKYKFTHRFKHMIFLTTNTLLTIMSMMIFTMMMMMMMMMIIIAVAMALRLNCHACPADATPSGPRSLHAWWRWWWWQW